MRRDFGRGMWGGGLRRGGKDSRSISYARYKGETDGLASGVYQMCRRIEVFSIVYHSVLGGTVK